MCPNEALQPTNALRMARAAPARLFHALAADLQRYDSYAHSTGESMGDFLPTRPHGQESANEQLERHAHVARFELCHAGLLADRVTLDVTNAPR